MKAIKKFLVEKIVNYLYSTFRLNCNIFLFSALYCFEFEPKTNNKRKKTMKKSIFLVR